MERTVITIDSAHPHRSSSSSKPTQERHLGYKQKLAAALRLFGKFGFDEGVAGHITVRDPDYPDQFWVNPLGVSFKLICVSDLMMVNHDGDILVGSGTLNKAAFAIHSQIHKLLPNINAAAHSHSLYGKTWSAFGRLLDPITQDACAFYEDHAVFADYNGVVFDTSEGKRIAESLKGNKAAILKNHGLITTGHTVDEAAWWHITMERSCQAQLLAEAVGRPEHIPHDVARKTRDQVGTPTVGHGSFRPLFDLIVAEQPDFLN